MWYHKSQVSCAYRHLACCKGTERYVMAQFMVGMSCGLSSFQTRVCTLISLLLHAVILLLCTTPIAKSTITHLYWHMKNCSGDPDVLGARMMRISKHFQVSVCT